MNGKRVIEVDDFDHRVIVEALADRRNDFISDDVSSVLLKVIDAPSKKGKRRQDRDER